MKSVINGARLSVLSVALFGVFSAYGQTDVKGTMGEVVVTATRIAVPITEVIADVSIISRSDLEQAGQSSLKDMLEQQPGVQISNYGSYRSATSVFLRGATSSQAIVLIDGVRVGSATSGSVAFENMPLDRIERIEILRGAASALYGPDAIGGVIQIFTREPGEGVQLAAKVGAGSDGQRQIGASVRGRSGDIGYSLGLSREKASGISVTNNPLVGGYNPDQDSFDVSSVDAKLIARLSKDHVLTLGLMRSEMIYQIDDDAANEFLPNPLNLTSLTTDAWTRPVLNLASLKWDAQWTQSWGSSLNVSNSDDELVIDYLRATDGALNTRSHYNTHRTQATWQNNISLDQDVLTVLLETRSEAVDSSTEYTVKRREINSAMLSYALNKPNWNALAVLRHDENSQFGGFDNWALSGGYKLTPNLRAVASVGSSFQAPNFNQLYYPGFGTSTLTPQQNLSNELGVKYQDGSLSAGVVVYHTEIKGFIDPTTNVQESLAVLRGLTLSLQNQFGNTRYAASYDYADPRTEPNDLPLVRIARNVLNLNVHHRLNAVTVFGELKISSDRADNNLDFSGREVLAGYSVLNAGLSWKISKDLSLMARINNLTDSTFVLVNGYAMPGRNVFMSLSWAM